LAEGLLLHNKSIGFLSKETSLYPSSFFETLLNHTGVLSLGSYAIVESLEKLFIIHSKYGFSVKCKISNISLLTWS